jgi:hypothetical protein
VNMSPTSSTWRELLPASAGYGLTKGTKNAVKIELTELGRRLVAPKNEGDDAVALAEAALQPTILGGFLRKYDKAKFPPDTIAQNVLMQDFGVPKERLVTTLQHIKENATLAGFLNETPGRGLFVAIDVPEASATPLRLLKEDDADATPQREEPEEGSVAAVPLGSKASSQFAMSTPLEAEKPLRVFIAHGKNLGMVEQVKGVLELYDIPFEVAEEGETTAIPVSEKVRQTMNRCTAAIAVVTADEADKHGDEYRINMNVNMEIGAAFVLYGYEGTILVWDKRVKVPSNIQGLYRMEFEGEELSFASGTKLAMTVKGLKDPKKK